MVTMAFVGMRVSVCCRRCRLLLLMEEVVVVVVEVVADVTESQQAIVRVTPADGMQPFTMQSKGGQEERTKREHGRKNKKQKNKRREADYNHK